MRPNETQSRASLGLMPNRDVAVDAPNETVRGIAALAALPADAAAAEAMLTVAATSLLSLRLRPHGRPCWQEFIAAVALPN